MVDPEIFLSNSHEPRWEESFNDGSFSGNYKALLNFGNELILAEQPDTETKVGEEGIQCTSQVGGRYTTSVNPPTSDGSLNAPITDSEDNSSGSAPLKLPEEHKRSRGRRPDNASGLVSADFKEGNIKTRRQIFRLIRSLLLDRKSFIHSLKPEFLASIDLKTLVSMAEHAKSPDSRNPANSPDSWNIIRLVCYRYKKQHCESFFRDPRLYKLFLSIFSNEEYL